MKHVASTVGYFFKEGKKYMPCLWAALVLNAVFYGIEMYVTALYTGKLVDCLISREKGCFFQNVTAFLITQSVISIIRYIIERWIERGCGYTQLDLEDKLSQKALRLRYSVVESSTYHDSLSRAQQGLSWVSGGFYGMVTAVREILSQLIGLVFVLRLLAELSMMGVLTIVATAIMTIYITFVSQRRDVRFRKRLVPVNRKLGYYLNIFKETRIAKEIRLFSGQALLRERARKFMDEEWKIERNRTRFGNKYNGLITVMQYFTQAALFLILLQKVVLGDISVGEFSTLSTAGISMYLSLVSLTKYCVELEKSCTFLSDYVSYMNLQEENYEYEEDDVTNGERFESIEFSHVFFRYPNSTEYALQDVSLKINAGERVIIVGRNGAGKTSLAKLFCRLYEPDSGTIYVNGKNIKDIPINAYRKMISAVFQDFQLFDVSIQENIVNTAGLDLRQLDDILERLGLSVPVYKLPNGIKTYLGKTFQEDGVEMSGGEKQKIAMARAMMRAYEILLLDEPTAALDPLAEQEIYDSIIDISKGKTILMISHRMSLCTVAERVIMMANGCIIGDGTHLELLAKKEYFELWNAQANLYYNQAME